MKRLVGLVVPAFEQGGGVPSVAMFLRRTILASGRYDVRIVSLATARNDARSLRLAKPSTWIAGAIPFDDEWSGVEFTHVGAVVPELEFQRYMPRAALTQALVDCDLIQVVCGSPAWSNAVVGIGKPVAMHTATRARVERRRRDTVARSAKELWRKGMTSITDRMDDRALRRVDAIQAMNPWMLEYANNINAKREVDIRYAPPGIDARRYRPLRQARAAELVRSPYVLCVGRLDDPRKNVGLLLNAYAGLPPVLLDRTRLVLAGSSAPPEAFWRHAESLGVREKVNHILRPDPGTLLGLYHKAAVLALPSDEEGFGMVAIEAMACGVPVVATRCGGPEGIITDCSDGFLVPRDDVCAMTVRLTQLLQDSQRNEAMGLAARATVEQRYDERIAGAVFTDMWERLLHKTQAKSCAG